MIRPVRICAAILLALMLLGAAGCDSGQQPSTPAQQGGSEQTDTSSGAGESDGAALAQEKCSRCHSFDRVASATKDRAGWESTIDRMVGNGLEVTDAERQAIVDYLVSK